MVTERGEIYHSLDRQQRRVLLGEVFANVYLQTAEPDVVDPETGAKTYFTDPSGSTSITVFPDRVELKCLTSSGPTRRISRTVLPRLDGDD